MSSSKKLETELVKSRRENFELKLQNKRLFRDNRILCENLLTANRNSAALEKELKKKEASKRRVQDLLLKEQEKTINYQHELVALHSKFIVSNILASTKFVLQTLIDL